MMLLSMAISIKGKSSGRVVKYKESTIDHALSFYATLFSRLLPMSVKNHVRCCRIEFGISLDDLIHSFKEILFCSQLSSRPMD